MRGHDSRRLAGRRRHGLDRRGLEQPRLFPDPVPARARTARARDRRLSRALRQAHGRLGSGHAAGPILELAQKLSGEEPAAARVRDIYLKEAAAHAATLKAQCGEWRASAPSAASEEFMRAAHTLASCSRTAGFEAIAQLGAELEQWMPYAARTAEDDAAPVAAAIDRLADMVAAVGRGQAPARAVESIA